MQITKRSLASKIVVSVMLLALILSIIAVSTPNMLSARKSANESSAVGSLRTINTAVVSYGNEHNGESPQSLSDLYMAGYIDQGLASGQKSGYTFHYQTSDDGSGTSYKVEAIPTSPGTSGVNRFATDQRGVIFRAQPGGPMRTLDGDELPPPSSKPAPAAGGRMVTRGSCLELIVEHPDKTLAQVRAIAAQFGGYVESSRLSGEESEHPTGEIKLRVPATRYEEARERVRRLGRSAGEETDNSHDVTGPYVDLQATLRNDRAEEAQYLDIMRRAGSIKDTLAVAEKLADVRGRIERIQGQLNVMSQQVEMASLSVTLRTEPVVQAPEVRWHPGAQVKASFWSGVDNLTTYADFMLGVLFQLPVMLLWIATVLAAAAISWRTLCWTWRRFFAPLPAAT